MTLFRFDKKSDPLASHTEFVGRLAANVLAATLLLVAVLGVGMYGYRRTEGMRWVDAFVNSAMLIGGMGPVTPLGTDEGKLFAGFYAIACGLVFVLVSGVVLAPVMHRVLHAMHVDDSTDDGGQAGVRRSQGADGVDRSHQPHAETRSPAVGSP